MPNELLVSRLGAQTWAALRSEGRPVELHVASPTRPDLVERIVRGRVCGVRPEIESAFVEIGMERPAFIRAADLLDEPGAPLPAPPIQDRLKVGRQLIVQIVRGPAGDKGARVTCRVGLPGRWLVCRPFDPGLKVSGRVENPAKRRRLLELLERCPAEPGWIARTSSAAADEAEILSEADRLAERARRIENLVAATGKPGQLLEEAPDLLDRLLRDLAPESLERIVVDTPEDRERVAGRYPGRVELHSGPSPLVESYGLVAEAARALSPRVPLRCGGYLVIEQTEALLAVDVNSGGFTGRQGPGEAAVQLNLEAVTEVARQLRLRDLGGTVLIDLVEMAAEGRLRVGEALERALRQDGARTRVVGWSDRRLLHLTRRRRGPGLDAVLARVCTECAGRGTLESELLVAAEALAGMRKP